MLEIVWFILWGLLWAVYFALDGFDFGMGTMMPFVAKNSTERRIIYNAAGPFWDGNEVWLVSAGGITFAAFPHVYAVMFSALYAPLFIILFALIFRAVSFEFRAKIDSNLWRAVWDFFQVIGNAIPAFFFGLIFANLFKGIPIDGEGVYHGTFAELFNVYGIAGGILFTVMFAYHGMLWLAIKTSSTLHDRALLYAKALWGIVLLLTVVFLYFSYVHTTLFINYLRTPALFIILLLAVVGLISSLYFLYKNRPAYAWFGSAVFILAATAFGLAGMFPRMLISSLDEAFNLTLHNAAGSELTLSIMLGIVLVTVPAVIGYQLWVFLTFTHKITEEELKSKNAY